MKTLKNIMVLVLFISVLTAFVYSDDSKVRITATKANIRLSPTAQSEVISTIPLGAILEVIKKDGAWYFVKLPPDEKGIVVTGYIHQSTVELYEEREQPVIGKKEIAIEKSEEKINENAPRSFETRQNISIDSGYTAWKQSYFKAESDYKSWKKYVYIGMFSCFGGSLASCLIPLLSRHSSTTLLVLSMAAALGGTGLWIYAGSRRSSASEKMSLLMNEGRIKRYISAYINPATKQYAVSFSIAF